MLFPGGSISPDDLAKLSRVCRTACEETGLALNSAKAEAIATNLMKLFMNGLTDEDELLFAVRRRAVHAVHEDPHPLFGRML